MKKNSIRVDVEFAIGPNNFGEIVKNYLITAKNFGNKVIILSMLYAELPKGMKIVYTVPVKQGRLPYKLEPGDSFSVPWPISDLKQCIEESDFRGLKETRAFFVDKLDEKHYSDLFSLEDT